MLHGYFDLHPQVVAWYEPRTIWVYADPGRPHDRFTAEDATPRVKRYIRRRFLKHQLSHGDLRVMEKTPSNLMRIPYVRAIFPESRYVYVIRSAFPYLSSSELRWRLPITLGHTWERLREVPKTQLPYYLHRYVRDHIRIRILRHKHASIWGVRYPGVYEDLAAMSVEEVIARQWAAASRQAEADLADMDPSLTLRIRYEDFVADPVNQFERILHHFDLSMTAELAAHVGRQTDPTRHDKWRRLDPGVLARCWPLIAGEMERHGYEKPPGIPAQPTPDGARTGHTCQAASRTASDRSNSGNCRSSS